MYIFTIPLLPFILCPVGLQSLFARDNVHLHQISIHFLFVNTFKLINLDRLLNVYLASADKCQQIFEVFYTVLPKIPFFRDVN